LYSFHLRISSKCPALYILFDFTHLSKIRSTAHCITYILYAIFSAYYKIFVSNRKNTLRAFFPRIIHVSSHVKYRVAPSQKTKDKITNNVIILPCQTPGRNTKCCNVDGSKHSPNSIFLYLCRNLCKPFPKTFEICQRFGPFLTRLCFMILFSNVMTGHSQRSLPNILSVSFQTNLLTGV
jgi:hypothetical protein